MASSATTIAMKLGNIVRAELVCEFVALVVVEDFAVVEAVEVVEPVEVGFVEVPVVDADVDPTEEVDAGGKSTGGKFPVPIQSAMLTIV